MGGYRSQISCSARCDEGRRGWLQDWTRIIGTTMLQTVPISSCLEVVLSSVMVRTSQPSHPVLWFGAVTKDSLLGLRWRRPTLSLSSDKGASLQDFQRHDR